MFNSNMNNTFDGSGMDSTKCCVSPKLGDFPVDDSMQPRTLASEKSASLVDPQGQSNYTSRLNEAYTPRNLRSQPSTAQSSATSRRTQSFPSLYAGVAYGASAAPFGSFWGHPSHLMPHNMFGMLNEQNRLVKNGRLPLNATTANSGFVSQNLCSGSEVPSPIANKNYTIDVIEGRQSWGTGYVPPLGEAVRDDEIADPVNLTPEHDENVASQSLAVGHSQQSQEMSVASHGPLHDSQTSSTNCQRPLPKCSNPFAHAFEPRAVIPPPASLSPPSANLEMPSRASSSSVSPRTRKARATRSSRPRVRLDSPDDSKGVRASHSRFACSLDLPTSMADSANDIPVTYMDKGQPYCITIKDTASSTPAFVPGTKYRTFVGVSFEKQDHKNMPEETWTAWQQGRGLLEAQERGYEVNAVEYIDNSRNTCPGHSRPELESSWSNGFCVNWEPIDNHQHQIQCAIMAQVNFLSTDFSQAKGIKGTPVRLCVKTIALEPGASDVPFSETRYCRVQIFRDNGAERKINIDEKRIQKAIAKLQKEKETTLQQLALSLRHGSPTAAGSPASASNFVNGVGSGRGRCGRGSDGKSLTALVKDLDAQIAMYQRKFSTMNPVTYFNVIGEPSDDPDVNRITLPKIPLNQCPRAGEPREIPALSANHEANDGPYRYDGNNNGGNPHRTTIHTNGINTNGINTNIGNQGVGGNGNGNDNDGMFGPGDPNNSTNNTINAGNNIHTLNNTFNAINMSLINPSFGANPNAMDPNAMNPNAMNPNAMNPNPMNPNPMSFNAIDPNNNVLNIHAIFTDDMNFNVIDADGNIIDTDEMNTNGINTNGINTNGINTNGINNHNFRDPFDGLTANDTIFDTVNTSSSNIMGTNGLNSRFVDSSRGGGATTTTTNNTFNAINLSIIDRCHGPDSGAPVACFLVAETKPDDMRLDFQFRPVCITERSVHNFLTRLCEVWDLDRGFVVRGAWVCRGNNVAEMTDDIVREIPHGQHLYFLVLGGELSIFIT